MGTRRNTRAGISTTWTFSDSDRVPASADSFYIYFHLYATLVQFQAIDIPSRSLIWQTFENGLPVAIDLHSLDIFAFMFLFGNP
jgi:hypothetical protein